MIGLSLFLNLWIIPLRPIILLLLPLPFWFILHADKRWFEGYIVVLHHIELVNVFDLTFILLIAVFPGKVVPDYTRATSVYIWLCGTLVAPIVVEPVFELRVIL